MHFIFSRLPTFVSFCKVMDFCRTCGWPVVKAADAPLAPVMLRRWGEEVGHRAGIRHFWKKKKYVVKIPTQASRAPPRTNSTPRAGDNKISQKPYSWAKTALCPTHPPTGLTLTGALQFHISGCVLFRTTVERQCFGHNKKLVIRLRPGYTWMLLFQRLTRLSLKYLVHFLSHPETLPLLHNSMFWDFCKFLADFWVYLGGDSFS